jgi:hypothetical protein
MRLTLADAASRIDMAKKKSKWIKKGQSDDKRADDKPPMKGKKRSLSYPNSKN